LTQHRRLQHVTGWGMTIPWRELKKTTRRFWGTYYDEAHAVLSPDWQPPAGFNMAALQADLKAVAS
jgi:hypothetical protein